MGRRGPLGSLGVGAASPGQEAIGDRPHVQHTLLSSSAQAEDPIRRGFSDQSLASLDYWIVRRSLSSGAHSRDPLAGDDD